MPEQPSQEQLLDCFASHVSPQKVKMYRMWGVDFIPGRREGVRVWGTWKDIERLRRKIHVWAREAGIR